jgi:hypothetical protein
MSGLRPRLGDQLGSHLEWRLIHGLPSDHGAAARMATRRRDRASSADVDQSVLVGAGLRLGLGSRRSELAALVRNPITRRSREAQASLGLHSVDCDGADPVLELLEGWGLPRTRIPVSAFEPSRG